MYVTLLNSKNTFSFSHKPVSCFCFFQYFPVPDENGTAILSYPKEEEVVKIVIVIIRYDDIEILICLIKVVVCEEEGKV